MPKQASTNLDALLENMTLSVNNYEITKDKTNIDKIKVSFMDLFDVKYVALWKYNVAEKKIVSIICKEKIEIDIEASLIKNVIKGKRPQIENHIISHKLYKPKIDNPFKYPLKSMIIYPIIEDGVVQGILTLAKDLRQRILFVRETIVRIEKFKTVLLALIKSYQDPFLEDKEQDVVIKKEKNEQVKIVELVKEKPLKTIKNDVPDIQKEVEVEQSKSIPSSVESKDEKLQLEIIALKEEVAYLKAKDEVTSEVEDTNKRYIKLIEQMTVSQKISQKQVAYLEVKVQKLEEEKIGLSNQNKRDSNTYMQTPKATIESLLIRTLPNLVRCEQIYILYEFIIYALQGSSSKISEINNKISKSKILRDLLNEPEYEGIVPVNRKLTNIMMFISKLKILQDKFLTDKINVNIISSVNVPAVLNFDRDKAVNLCFHLMSDMTQFIDLNTPLNVTLEYIDNMLHIRVYGKKHRSLHRLLNKRKFISNLKERTALAMSKKIIDILSGKLNSYVEGEYCIHQLVIPANRS